eukprot:TRINITY_DN1212_c0_g1_i1.p1 TRINITY_DN1212_c0_g1~~TRINITY_DN1212_c0_g1_i1.p1  ORF type:complete len:498 (+),score=111.84 TRINITY_DN1212_c0_g1_i1:48-1496(+)
MSAVEVSEPVPFDESLLKKQMKAFDDAPVDDEDPAYTASLQLLETTLDGDLSILLTFTSYKEALNHLLVGPNPTQQRLLTALRLYQVALSTPSAVTVLVDDALLEALVKLVAHQNPVIASNAVGVFSKSLMMHTEGLSVLFKEGGTMQTLKRRMIAPEGCKVTTLFRFFDIAAASLSVSEDSHKLAVELGLGNVLLQQVESDDILHRLASFDFIENLAAEPRGFDYLVKEGLIAKMIAGLKEGDEDFGDMVVNRYAQVFARVARSSDQSATQLVTTSLFETVLDLLAEQTSQDSLIPLLGALSVCQTGLAKLLQTPAAENPFVISLQSSDLCVPTLSALTEIFGGSGDVTSLEKLFELLNSSDSPILPYLLKTPLVSPFFDLRAQAYAFLQAISAFVWGKKAIAATPDLIPTLLNRAAEQTNDGFAWKFSILQSLVSELPQGLTPKALYSALVAEEIMIYLKQGMVYVHAVAEPVVQNSAAS